MGLPPSTTAPIGKMLLVSCLLGLDRLLQLDRRCHDGPQSHATAGPNLLVQGTRNKEQGKDRTRGRL